MGCGVHPLQCVGQGGAWWGLYNCDLNDSSWVCKDIQKCLDGAKLEVYI